ncbi:hypothetical protein [Streptomyces sp. NPDC004783]|uniref:hypothetical protein n=1 Tax=Streptomyces sp. NPDC004783 TaxID=3154459 RepID=UPI0033A352E3
MDHRAPDRAGTLVGRAAGRVPALLLTARDALREASRLGVTRGAAEADDPPARFVRNLTSLRREAEDATSSALGGAPDEADRRSVLTALYVRADMGRIAVLIEQVGDIALGRGARPFAEPVAAHVRELAAACPTLMAQAHDVLRSPGPPSLLDRGLADIADRQRHLSHALLTGGPDCPTRDAVDAAVLGRCYEECAWRTVALTRVALHGPGAAPRRP